VSQVISQFVQAGCGSLVFFDCDVVFKYGEVARCQDWIDRLKDVVSGSTGLGVVFILIFADNTTGGIVEYSNI
jgi:hypothetical protein